MTIRAAARAAAERPPAHRDLRPGPVPARERRGHGVHEQYYLESRRNLGHPGTEAQAEEYSQRQLREFQRMTKQGVAMATPWREYSSVEVGELGRTAPPLTDTAERTCPRCGQKKVRRYLYDRARTDRMVGISCVWCSNCHGYTATTGAAASDYFEFPDPADDLPALARSRDGDLMALLDLLDRLWDDGVLPQRMTPRRKR
jgi:hypothetical protein